MWSAALRSTRMKKNPLGIDEWEHLQVLLPLGSLVIGKVVCVHPFGVFLDIGLDPRWQQSLPEDPSTERRC